MFQLSLTKPKITFKNILAGGFFVWMLLFHEVLLHSYLYASPFFSLRLLLIVLSAAGSGLIITVIVSLLPPNCIFRCLWGFLTFFFCFFAGLEYCLKYYFGNSFSLTTAIQMAPQVFSNYRSDITSVITTQVWYIVLAFVPLILYIIFGRKIVSDITALKAHRFKLLIPAALLEAGVVAAIYFTGQIGLYTTDFSADRAIESFGLCTDLQLEISYAVTGVPSENFTFDDPTDLVETVKYNVTELDFSKMAESETDETIKTLDQYFATVTPTVQNAYTGIFANKNLILITAESFCPYMISETLTPALYQLTHQGIIAEDFYQPLWGQSTTGGEYAVMTGMIPAWIDDNCAFAASVGKSMPYSLGWQLRARGYKTVAYHNGSFTFYDRNLTHPNLGYDFAANGGTALIDGTVLPDGLTFSTSGIPSDVELFNQTLPALIQNYVETGQPYHAAYMTVSGHGRWSWSHGMAQKNQQLILDNYPNLSETSQAYLASNMELEYAMEYVLATLEASGTAQNTVIALAADHYPYFMVTDSGDYYDELRGFSDSEGDIGRYKNAMILWCGSMTEPVTISTPCIASDILPTLLNLFGIEYDSRLLSGRDLLAEDLSPGTAYNGMPVAVIPTASGTSWKTAAGSYESSTGVFTPNEGVTVDENYATAVDQIVKAKYAYAGTVIQTDYFKIAMDALAAQRAEKQAAEQGQQENNGN